MRSRLCGSTPTVGSSSSTTAGLMQDAAGDVQPALRMPPENCLTDSFARSASPVCSSAQSTCLRELRPRARAAAERLEILARRQQRIERDLLRHDAELGRRLPAVEHAVEQRISPPSSRTRPAIARISVVLPAPFGPSSASSSP